MILFARMVASKGRSELLIRYALSIRLLLTQNIEHIAQHDRIVSKPLQELPIHYRKQVNSKNALDGLYGRHIDRNGPCPACVIGERFHIVLL